MTDESILRGHKRVGKRFIPPMKQLPSLKLTSYVNDILPELIWLGLINDRLGFIRGARFFEKIVTAATNVAGEPPYKNFALVSQLGALNATQKKSFLCELSKTDILEPLRDYVAPMILLYDDCPIEFIGSPNANYRKSDLIKVIRDCVGRHIDKYETPGIVLNGTILLARLVAGTISLQAEMPNFNAIVDDPASEEAKRAAAFMRANALAEFGMLEIDNGWARNFWNKNFEICECEFSYEKDV
jgi:hypothetical protein